MSSNTIGSHSKKILVNINKFKGCDNTYKQLINQFLGITYGYFKNNDKVYTTVDGKQATKVKYAEKALNRVQQLTGTDMEKYK